MTQSNLHQVTPAPDSQPCRDFDQVVLKIHDYAALHPNGPTHAYGEVGNSMVVPAPSSELPTPLRIMSFDGGPASPMILHLLEHIEINEPGFLQRTHMFCGTSDGSMIALALSWYLQRAESEGLPVPPNGLPKDKDTPALRAIRHAQAFEEKVVFHFRPTAKEMLWFASGLRPLLGETLRNVLDETFGNAELKDLSRPVSLMAFNATKNQLNTFVSHGPQAWPHVTLKQAALAASAMPFVLPISRAPKVPDGPDGLPPWFAPEEGDLLLDGGVANNNPMLAGLSDALLILTWARQPPDSFWTPRKYTPFIRLLSFGGGARSLDFEHLFLDKVVDRLGAMLRRRPLSAQEELELHWGWWKLIFGVGPGKLIDLLLSGPSASEHRVANQLLGVHRFKRFEWPMSLSDRAARVLMATSQRAVRKVMEKSRKDADTAWTEEWNKYQGELGAIEPHTLPGWIHDYWGDHWHWVNREKW